MNSIVWPNNFPNMDAMYELIQKTAKASWRNDDVLTLEEITQWLNNFTGEVYSVADEQRLALWLLCNFTFYNEDEINHLCYVLFQKLIHDLAVHYDINSSHELNHIIDRISFSAMGNASESGGLVLYYFRQQSHLGIKKFFYPSTLPKENDGIVVVIDDVTLSGGSATSFLKNNLEAMHFDRAYYLTLFASQLAIKKMEDMGIVPIQSTILGERERCFSEDSLIFTGFPELREITKKMVKSYGKKLYPQYPLGYKDGQYCFGMHYNTPNNTLPIFWSYNDWTPIFPRKEKIYSDTKRINFEKYI